MRNIKQLESLSGFELFRFDAANDSCKYLQRLASYLTVIFMKTSRFLPTFLLPCVFALPPVIAAPSAPAKTAPAKKATTPQAAQPLQGEARIVHALNRLSFGARPGDVKRVQNLGLGKWIEEQLHPETIDDSAFETQLQPLSMLRATPETLALAYKADNGPIGKLLRESAQKGRAPQVVLVGGNPNAQKKALLKGQAQNNAAKDMVPDGATTLNAAQMADWKQIQKLGFARGEGVAAVGQLVDAKIARAIDSKKQLQEVLVDFWSNHFNLDVRKGPVQTLKIVDDREVIRPRVFASFRELLGASAKSPAMLLYLDNANSTAEMTNRRNNKTRGGINENYARELMELHTLGVDGGYTQKDVQEVARCFTGWSINRDSGTFQFRPFAHDKGAKTVLGQTIPAGGGIEDGERVLDILAAQPATAKFLSAKLCRRLVSDDPSPQLVARIAQKWTQSQGDLRAVISAIAYDPEFYASTTRADKIKSPFEFAVSGVRALNGHFNVPDPEKNYGRLRLVADGAASMQRGGGRPNRGELRTSMAQAIANMGQPLFGYQAPTGYSEDSTSWVSTGALVARLNFALDLAGNQIAHVRVEPENVFNGVSADDHNAVLERAGQALLNAPLSERTRATLQKQMPENTPADATKLVALVLGSPEFQRR